MFLRAVAAGLPCYRLSQVVAANLLRALRLRRMRGAILYEPINENGRADARPSQHESFAEA